MNQGIIYAIATAILMSVGQIFFKKSSIFIEENGQLSFFLKYLCNTWLYGGVFIFGIATLLWIKALSFGKMASLYPIQSIAYIAVAILAFYIFKEKISYLNFLGMIIIILGVFFVSQGK